jgi:hypothetical protein
MKIKPEIYFIQTLPDEYLNNSLQSFQDTVGENWDLGMIEVIQELDTREVTLNEIISRRDKHRDLLVVADDIVFLGGWYEALNENYDKGDIIGFSMIDAKTGLLQDFGYDFITLDGGLSYRGLYKHDPLAKHKLPVFRYCDAITGCAMYIKYNVFHDVSEFPKEGVNRWGELLFSQLARKYGYKTIVLNAHLKHYATSTKQKKDVTMSSMSWLIEKGLWSKVVDKYLTNVKTTISSNTHVSGEIIKLISNSNKCLIYGAGTIANAILYSTLNTENIDLCSGLEEEGGKYLAGIEIQDVSTITFTDYDVLIISSIGYEKIIYRKYFQDTINSSTTKYVTLSKSQKGNSMTIAVDQIKSSHSCA